MRILLLRGDGDTEGVLFLRGNQASREGAELNLVEGQPQHLQNLAGNGWLSSN